MTASIEVIDAVQQLLESEGVLQSIRAQLRASVINALSTKTSDRRTSKAVEFVNKVRGQDCILCVMDLLTKLNLRETLTVFEAEIGMSNAVLNSQSSRDNLSEKLCIMSSIGDVYEPILYQLLEATVSASIEKDKSPRTTVEVPPQRISQTPLTSKSQHVLGGAVAASSLSPVETRGSAVEKSSFESEFKKQEVRTVSKDANTRPYLGNPKGDIEEDSNDDSFADDKSSDVNSLERDSKRMKNEMKGGDSSPKGIFNNDQESDDEKSYDDPEGDDDDIEVGADSESSTSFSLEYGYVEDSKSTDLNSKVKDKSDEKKGADGDAKNCNGDGIEKAKPMTTLSVTGLQSSEATLPNAGSENVGVQKLGHGAVNISKLSWNSNQSEPEDDFLFSEESVKPIHEKKSMSKNSDNVSVVGKTGGTVKTGQGNDDSIEETVLTNSTTSKATTASVLVPAPVPVPVARSSWGSIPTANEKTKKDEESESDAGSMAEDDMSVGQSDSDSDSDSEDEKLYKSSFQARGGEKGKGKEDEENESLKKEVKGERGNNDGSLFMSRTQSGALPSVASTISTKMQNAVDSTIGYDDDDDNESAEFDADADYSKDEDTYMSSHSSKLSEVERKLAEMERADSGLKALRLEDESTGKKESKNMNISAMTNGGDGDYSEEDFESGSEHDNEVGDDSVASEDIEAMELSVGGAGSESDGSFSGLNHEFSNDKFATVPDKKNSGPIIDKNKKNVLVQKSKILKNESDDSDFSHSGTNSDSGEMEFSTNDIEMSSSRGIESDGGYDFTAKPVSVQTGKGSKDRNSSGW